MLPNSGNATHTAYRNDCFLSSQRGNCSRIRPNSKHRYKVAVAREYSRDGVLHAQAHLAADSLIAKSHECVLQYGQQDPPQQSSQVPAWRANRIGSAAKGSQHDVESTTAVGTSSGSSSSSSSNGNSSRPGHRWPWSWWTRGGSSSSTTTTTTSSSSGGGGATMHGSYSRSSVTSQYTILQASAAAVKKGHARRGLVQAVLHRDSTTSSTSASAAHTTAAAAAGATASTAVISSTAYLQSFSGTSSSGSSTSSSWEESSAALRTIEETWDADSSDSSSTAGGSSQLFLYDIMPPAAAAAAAAEVPSSSSSRLSLLLGDTYPAALAGNFENALSTHPQTSHDSTPAAGASESADGHQFLISVRGGPAWRSNRSWQQQLRSRGGVAGGPAAVPVPNASALQQSLRAVDPPGRTLPPSRTSGTSSKKGQSSSSSSSSASTSSSEESDWLTAVLSAPTSRLSSHSNTVLTNSLRRLASLRSTAGGAAAASGGTGAAAAVDGAEGLLDSIRGRLGTFQLHQFEEVALQLAQLGYSPDQNWLEAFDRSSMAAMAGGSPRLLSRLLLARAKLPGPVSNSWCAACCEHMAAAPHKLSASSWVNALYALVRLKHEPDRRFQTTFFAATAERLDDVSPELLTHLVWSLGRLKFAPSYMWWRSLITATASIEKPFSHAQLASLVHSIALWAEPGAIAAHDVQRLIDLLLVEIHEQLGVLQPVELTTIVWSLGSLIAARKLRPDHELLDELLSAIHGQLPRLSHVQISNLCWGLAKLNHRLPDGFAEALLMEVQAQLPGFRNSNLCSVLWAVARLEMVPLGPFRQQLWEELRHRTKSLCPHDLSTLLWALAQLQLQPPEDVLQDLCEATAPHLAACGATHLTNIIWALGRLQAQPDMQWVEAAEAASLKVLPTAGLSQVVNLTWGLSQLRHPAAAAGARSSFHTSPHSDADIHDSPSLTDGHTSTSSPLSEVVPDSSSPAWQAACLRELRLRCMCAGHDVDCGQLVPMLQELGVLGLAPGAAAVADKLFIQQEDDAYCSLLQPGCR